MNVIEDNFVILLYFNPPTVYVWFLLFFSTLYSLYKIGVIVQNLQIEYYIRQIAKEYNSNQEYKIK